MLIAVTGGRAFADAAFVFATLDAVRAKHPGMRLIVGRAPGADCWAELWANERQVPVEPFIAEWERLGRRAGPERNQRMCKRLMEADFTERGCVAFPGGRGTRDMTERCKALGIPVWYVPYRKGKSDVTEDSVHADDRGLPRRMGAHVPAAR